MIRDFESHRPKIDPTVWVDDAALVIGQVSIGPDSSIWPMSVLRGDVHRIDIGARTNVQDGSMLHVTHDGPYAPGGLALSIGDDVTVGHKVILHACTIGNRVLIGMGAIIMDGARIASDSIIGAGALVTPGKALEGGYLWIGSPVRRARALTDPERQYLKYSAQHYVRLAGRHRGDGPAASDSP